MKKEDLIALKEKISKLSEEEKKQRDLYLRGISSGDIEGPMTGYASIDKPWLKYIDYGDYCTVLENKNVYQELYDNNAKYGNNLALMYFGAKITYFDFFENIEKTAKSLKAFGVKKGDFVTIVSALNPETLYTFYALAKIGAVANFMSPFFDKNGMIERIKDCNSEIIIVMDQFYPDLKENIDKTIIKKKIILPTLNSSMLRFVKRPCKIDKENNEIYWNQFIQEGKKEQKTETIKYEKDLALALVYSSGTTGASKAILLTHDSFENSIHAYQRCGVKLMRGDVYYQIIPPWFSTGISTSAHLPLSNGGTLFMDPRFDRKIFINNMLKLNPSGTIAPISMFQGFLQPELLKKGNLSNLNVAFQGGEKLEEEDKINIEKAFKKYGSSARLMNGYGQCECGAGISTQTINTPSNTTVGIQIPGVSIIIVDDQQSELTYNNRGEIFVLTPCGMREYYKNPQETESYYYKDEFGNKWSRTGDIGKLNQNGELEILGRTSDFSIVNNKKVYNFDIENSIRSFDCILNCDVFSDNDGRFVAHIILKDNSEINSIHEIIEKIQEKIYEDCQDKDMVPRYFKVRDNFPFAKSGKRDVAQMKMEKDGFINVDFVIKTKMKKF